MNGTYSTFLGEMTMRPYATIRLLAAIGLILCCSLSAFSAAVTVSGTVIDEKNETPIANAKVELTNANAGTGYFIGYTNTEGRFSFSDVRTNLPYDLAVFVDGFCPYEMKSWRIPANQQVVDLKIPLIRGAAVRGSVTLSDGETPIANAKIELQYQRGSFRMLDKKQTLFTDKKGVFEFTKLPPNVYTLTIDASGYLTERLVGVRPQPGEEKTYSVKLYRPASISGHVTLKDDATALPNIEIAARGASQGVGTTDDNGFYSVEQLRPGSYKLESVPAGFNAYKSEDVIQLEEGWNLENVNFSLNPLPPSMSLSLTRDVFLPDQELKFKARTFRIAQYESRIYQLPVSVFYSGEHDVEALLDDADLSPFSQALQWTVDVEYYKPYVWSDRDLKAPEKLGPGAYILQIANATDKLEHRLLFFVTELGIVTKRGKNQTLVYATNLRTSMPVPETKILMTGLTNPRRIYPNWIAKLRKMAGEEVDWSGKTDKQGVFVSEDNYPRNADVIAVSPEGYIAVSTMHKSYLIERQSATIFVYTDRPIYRPGQTIFYKAIIRRNEDEGYRIPSNESIGIKIQDPQGKIIRTDTVTINEWGSIDSSFSLPKSAPLGRYTILAKYGKAENSIHFYLEEYRKPEFKVTVTPEKSFYINGETLNFLVRSEYYFGAPVVNANARYRIYESVASGGYRRSFPSSYNRYLSGGEVTTDAEGIARIEFTPRRSSVDRKISVEVEVTEASGRQVTANGSAPVGVGQFYITARPKKHVYGPEDPLSIEIQTRNHEDKPVSVELTVEYTQDVWNAVRRRYVRPSRPFASLTVKTDEKGKALAEWLPDTKEVNGRVEVIITGKDERGNAITGSSSCWRMLNRSGSFHYQYPHVGRDF